MAKKLTPWLPAHMKPARAGMYELSRWLMPDLPAGDVVNCAFWNGYEWRYGIDPARKLTLDSTDKWRGLAQDPNAKQKKGKK